jgi:hypothetical protein
MNGPEMAELAESVRQWIRRDSGFRSVIYFSTTNGRQPYVVGGAVRTLLMGDRKEPRDLDIVLEEGSATLLHELSAYGLVERRAEDAGTVSLPNGRKVDIFSPSSFHPSCVSVEEMLRWFDLNVNAIAVPIGSYGMVINPVDGVHDACAGSTTLAEGRWGSADSREAVHLMLRLAELAIRLPSLTINNPDVLEARLNELGRVRDWRPAFACHGIIRSHAIDTLLCIAQIDRGDVLLSETRHSK